MVDGRTDMRTAFLSGQTRRITFQIVDKVTGDGFQPTTLAMSIYDVQSSGNVPVDTVYTLSGPLTGGPVTSAIVNSEDDTDVSAFVDSLGNVEVYLTPEDTDVEVPSLLLATPIQRRIRFLWTWDSPAKTGKHEIIIRIEPDREPTG